MKWMIASDIHGSAYWCRKLIERFKEEKADRLLLLGDLLYHGPRNDLPDEYAPKAVIELLNGINDKIHCVRGNCDAEVDQMVLKFPIMADYAVIDEGDRLVYATHGHVYSKDVVPPLNKGDIVLFGHTHVPECTEQNGLVFVNPGSVSIPKQNSRHSYMTLENKLFQWKDFDGEVYKEYHI